MEEIATTTDTATHPKQKLKKKRGPRRHYERRFPVRLKPDEIDLLKVKANHAGMSLSRYVVHSALTEKAITPEQRHYTERRLELLQAATEEVSRVGNNLNQIARQLNAQSGSLSSHTVEQTLKVVAETLDSLRKLWDREEAL